MHRSGWVVVNGVPTNVRTWGGWIEENFENSRVLVFITGNPGVTDFYVEFLNALYRLLTGTSIWVISHAGHQIPRNRSLPSIKKHPELYNLAGQVQHKKEFVKKYLPPDKILYLAGHSVGGKICAELMKDGDISSKASQVHLLCPTLEHIGNTPYGQLFQRYLGRMTTVCVLLASVKLTEIARPFHAFGSLSKSAVTQMFCGLPYAARFYFFKVLLVFVRWNCSAPSSLIHAFVKLIHPKAARAALSLGLDEMTNIKELDHEVYEKHGEKMTVYFAQSDGWAPLSLLDHLKSCHSNVKSVVFERNINHAFVNTSPLEVAAVLNEEINVK